MKIKVCGLKDRENILEVLAANPDYLGFIFYKKSPRYAGELEADFVYSINVAKKVGVFVNEKEMNILDLVARYGLDYVQLHGDESPEFCGSLAKSVPVIKSFHVDDSFDMKTVEAYAGFCKYFLFDSKSEQYGGSGKTFDHGKLNEYKLGIPFFLSGGISLENIPTRISNAYALDVNSKFENSPGIKDIEKIKELAKKIKA
jgi:phosphoribosylanthranilate isomerase